MRTQITRLSFLSILLVSVAVAAPVSRVTNFVDGNVLTASQLNSEFNNVLSGVNSINNAQVSASAQIGPEKIAASIKGSGISRDGTTGALSVKVDGTSVEISGDNLQIKDGGVTTAKIVDSAVTSAKILDGTIATADIADQAITPAKFLNRPLVDSVTTIAPLGAVAYRDINLTCNGPFGCSNTQGALVLTVSGNRPVRYEWIGMYVPEEPGTGSIHLTTASTASDATPYLFVGFNMALTSGSYPSNPYGATQISFKAASNGDFVLGGCHQISYVFYPTEAGTYAFRSQFSVGDTSAVTATVGRCRAIAYEL
jgi:hypothetical protein